MDGGLLDEQKLDPKLIEQLGPGRCGAIMNAWPKFTAVGAIGPDLFFWLQDYNDSNIPCDEIMLAMSLLYYLDDQGRLEDGPFDGLITIFSTVVGDTWAKILRFLSKLDALWQKFLKWWNETIGPIIAKAGQAVDDLSGGIFSALGDAITELKNGLVNLAEEELFESFDIFKWFSLKMRNGFDEQAFLWSDMTHYRRTSVIPARLIYHAREMLNDPTTAQHGEQLLAFALGWICHNGTDVIEHSFVNEQCGGPFRTHWQRHHLIENHIDGWNYHCTKDGTLPRDDFVGWQPSYPSIADSALYFAVQIPQDIDEPGSNQQGDLRQPLPEGTDSATQFKRKELLDTDGALPQWLAETIVQVFIEIYADPVTEGGDPKVQGALNEIPVPHPRNLHGQAFKDILDKSPDLIGKWLGILGIDNVGIALDELRQIIAPDLPETIPNIPEGFPFPWEIMAAYRFMLSWFKRSYLNTMDLDRPEPPTVFVPPASDVDIGPPDFSGVSSSDDPVSQTCEALAALLDWVFKSLEKAAQFLYDIAKSAASLVTWPAREAIYYAVTLPLWEATENIRMVLVHMGYMMPQSEQFWNDDPTGNLKRPNEVDESLVRLGHSVDSAFQEALASAIDFLGNLDNDPALNNVGVRDTLHAPNPWLPVRNPKPLNAQPNPANPVVEYLRPWAFPNTNNLRNDPKRAGNRLETPLTHAGPYSTDTLPNQLLQTDNSISNVARQLYQDAQNPNETDRISTAFVLHQGDGELGEGKYRGTNPMGDPVVFSTYLIGT